MNFKMSLLTISLSIALSGCGTKEEEDPIGNNPTNSPPSILISNLSVEVSENNSIEIPFNTIDTDGDEVSVNITIEPQIGSAQVNGSSVIYTPESVSEDTIVTLDFVASDGVSSTTQSVSVNVLNTTNSAPTLTVEANDFVYNENTSQSISFSALDDDGDDLVYSLTENSTDGVTISSNIDADLNQITLEIGETSELTGTASYTLSVSDGQQSVSEEISITVQNVNNEEPPVIQLNEQDVSIDEESEGSFTFTVSDDDTSISNLNINYNISPEIEADIQFEIDSEGNGTASFSGFSIEQDTQINFIINATDGIFNISETVNLNLINNLIKELAESTLVLDNVKEKFDFVKNQDSEVKLIDFYSTLASYTNESVLLQLDDLRTLILNSLDNERVSLEQEILDIREYLNNSQRDSNLFDQYRVRIDNLVINSNNFGLEAVELLNDASTLVDQGLPLISEDIEIGAFEVDNVTYYSRYVGNTIYGRFIGSNFVFNNDVKFMERINFLTNQCQ
jgi:hypothetical protein